MTLKSALQDVKETTLSAISGVLAKLSYLASLRRGHERYQHWGMAAVHGNDSAERALQAAHNEVMAGVLRMPLAALADDLEASSRAHGIAAKEYVDDMRGHFAELLPPGREQSPTSAHLSSVLLALSSLQRNRGRATRSTS